MGNATVKTTNSPPPSATGTPVSTTIEDNTTSTSTGSGSTETTSQPAETGTTAK